MNRVSWGSKLGFIFAVAGSAVGLANIWRFPYVVGQNGGAAFIAVYLLCLFLIGFPVFISEILIGRTTQTSPSGAFKELGRTAAWGWAGKLTILTGLLVSAFYSAVAGWILGYLVEAIKGNISAFESSAHVVTHYQTLMDNPFWGLSFHFFFLMACTGVLVLGVRSGIERGNKIMMPMLFIVLVFLAIWGLTMPNAHKGLAFLLTPDWSALSTQAILIALGQAFFTLSLGQGTMVTYGSYMGKKESLLGSCVPVVIMDTVISLVASIAVFTIVFAVELEPNSGPGLIFHTLPWAFSQIPFGHGVAVLFFLLIVLAALTSEISAMEPAIAYLIDEWKWKRTPAVLATGACAFLVGVPAALSYSLLKDQLIAGMTLLDFMSFVATSIMIPIGGFFAVILVGWRWGVPKALVQLKEGAGTLFAKQPWLSRYFWFCFKYSAPILIILVLLNELLSQFRALLG
ncbi:MAG TPA: sodium-dependent transporter [Parachlamydiaceae bacterium]|nr:sodium-dependent transporter [Parachlamydiaceae bacterium]